MLCCISSDPAFRKYAKKSTFDLRDVQDKKETVFFGISIDDIRTQSTMFKIIVNQIFLACRHDAPHNKRTLILLDEFLQLDS